MGRRKLQEINASSMADIAFMLLIFFLVATTMDVDKGLERKLPPITPDNQKPPDIKERNLLEVKINRHDWLLVEGSPLMVEQLCDKVKEFIGLRNQDAPNLPELTTKNVPGIGTVSLPKKAIISLQNDFGTSYGMYIRIQNELIRAYNEVRDEFAMDRFGKKFDDLERDVQKTIKKEIFPQLISEAEPVHKK